MILGNDLQVWEKVTLDFEVGRDFQESAETFRDYRLDVTFTNPDTGTTIVVPGFFAADGQAAETSASSGNVWRVNFNPPEAGGWSYEVSFRAGEDIAVKPDMRGVSADAIDGQKGSLEIAPNTGDDQASKGMLLQEEGSHYLRFQGDGDYFIKGGPGVPENLLAYAGFDGTADGRHDYATHLDDALATDPTWQGDEGQAVLGAVNYLAEKGLNTVYLLFNTAGGDGGDVMPWVNEKIYDIKKNLKSVEAAAEATDGVSVKDFSTYDVSKLDQWGRVFDHMDASGIYRNFLFQETENDHLLQGGTAMEGSSLSVEMGVYVREMIARFGHGNMLQWNLGEENTNTPEVRADMADLVKQTDPYDHLVVIHSYPAQVNDVYDPLIGEEAMDGTSFQVAAGAIRDRTEEFREKSAEAGDPWVLSWDEDSTLKSAIDAFQGDPNSENEAALRKGLWGHLTAGGSGVSWYVRATEGHGYDQNMDTFDGFESLWGWTAAATEFFNTHVPFWEMEEMDGLTANGRDYVMVDPGESYLVYLPQGEADTAIKLDLSYYEGVEFTGWWYDPRNGGGLIDAGKFTGGSVVNVGIAPGQLQYDWAFLLKNSKTLDDTPSDAVVAKNGLVVMEAESADMVGFWQDGSDIEGHTGDGAFTWAGKNRYKEPIEDSTLEYKFALEESGDYHLSLRCYRPQNGAASDVNNDFWIQIDDGPWIKMYFGGARGEWNWATRQDTADGHLKAIYDLDEGMHTIRIEGRSNWATIDRLHLNKGGFNNNADESPSDYYDGTLKVEEPRPAPDFATVDQDGSVLIDVKANDSAEGGMAGIDLVSGPANGSVIMVDGKFEYRPDADFFGDDSFVYELTDANGQSATAQVKIDVLPKDSVQDDVPAELEGLKVWFDASKGDASAISDLSGHGNDAFGTGVHFDADVMGWDFRDAPACELEDAVGLNLGIAAEGKTLAFVITPGQTEQQEVLWEQGGGVRGISVTLEDGQLHMTAWNLDADQGEWGPVTVSTDVEPGVRTAVSLLLDPESGTLTGYRDGVVFGSVDGVGTLFTHGDDIGLGGVQGWARDAAGNLLSEDGTGAFSGHVHEIAGFDSCLDGAGRAELDAYLADKWLSSPVSPFSMEGPSIEKSGVTYYGFGIDGSAEGPVAKNARIGVDDVGLGRDIDYRQKKGAGEMIGVDLGDGLDEVSVALDGLGARNGAEEAAMVTLYDINGAAVDSFVFSDNGVHEMSSDRSVHYATVEAMDWITDGARPTSDVDFSLLWMA
ncbi:DUF5060 domain-containing protein [Amaricoccus tamworthensis]|uniref:DUF5060 domain-containing protein n=1 Tax=Amaricoccus tamworthensis TaxID=57002 RepID=UPI003C7AB690